MDITLIVLLVGTLVLGGLIFAKSPELLSQALFTSATMFRGVWLEVALGFILAGFLEVLLPAPVLVRWLGGQNLAIAILMGWVIGLLLPGGPYLIFPVAANLLKQGVAPGPLIALLTAKMLLSPIRMLSFEVPLLGWPMTLARVLPALFLPPALGLLGQWLFQVLARR